MSISTSGTTPRARAITAAYQRPQRESTIKKEPVSSYFGELTFDLAKMREKLPKESYQNLLATLETGKKLSKETADNIASAIKEWAVANGATHFCHWFQPMTGLTAEKHDSFVSIQYSNHSEVRVMERFSGSQLIQGEPDASSFPSGGMRTTFEARGYTVWDPSSPIFIVEEENTRTLCIPTVFFGYHGQALDNKTPLLRSVEALSSTGCEFLKLLGDVDVKRLQATLGCEQEYFLVDKNFVALRPDLVMSGRTLLGAQSPRGQQLDDHYFGAIPGRAKAFMEEAERELYRLGIPVKTRHNEVAPSQFEVAPIFEDANISADHNALTMEVLKRVAKRHGLVCLLHEKPFAEINGSGKHCNWSMSNDKGENLLDPGKTPHQNLRFLATLAVVMKAVHEHAPLLRVGIASAGNDHRLGANEAPPAVISVFMGDTLSGILDAIEQGQGNASVEEKVIELGVSKLPTFARDNTDRNRTSPFAFTGNKFEFRAVGSASNVSVPTCFLNTAVAAEFAKATERLKTLLDEKSSRDEAVLELVKQLVTETKAIRFDGDGYSQEWLEEAAKRGLPRYDTTADALPVLKDESLTRFFQDMNVLSPDEIKSRYQVALERYNMTIDIEAQTTIEMVTNQVAPAIEEQLKTYYEVEDDMHSKTLKATYAERIAELENTFDTLLKTTKTLNQELQTVRSMEEEAQMQAYCNKVLPLMLEVRTAADISERIVADNAWPLPKYREMLFAMNLS